MRETVTEEATTTHRRRSGRPRGGSAPTGRAELLIAAERAIRLHGSDVTMTQIAEQAQVTKPILYRAIGDKAAVVDALSDLLIERIEHAVNAARTATSPRRQFTASIRAYLGVVEANRGIYLFVNSSGQRGDLLRRRIDTSARQLVRMFSSHAGVPDSSSAPQTWGHSIIGAMQTVTLMRIDVEPGDADDLDAVADAMAQLLWPGVAEILGDDATPG